MLSKSQISFVSSLHQKKYRKEHGLFLVEGSKSITEFLHSAFHIQEIFALPEALHTFGQRAKNIKITEVNANELKKISTLTTPQDSLALIRSPEYENPASLNFRDKISLVLDGVQDPGNLGTIIRTADWFGFTEIICSADTVEAYNPKVVQASMGSLARVKICYTDLAALFRHHDLPVFGALLNGESIYGLDWGKEGFLVLGNEGKGISAAIERLVTKKITIPRFGHAESLNVGVSAAIICSEIRGHALKA